LPDKSTGAFYESVKASKFSSQNNNKRN
jgi:hypothetical protein